MHSLFHSALSNGYTSGNASGKTDKHYNHFDGQAIGQYLGFNSTINNINDAIFAAVQPQGSTSPNFTSSAVITDNGDMWMAATEDSSSWIDIVLLIVKAIVFAIVILAAVFGNLLVIVSVIRYHKLRVITNYFVVSMALADMLVALMAMVFNASVQLTNTWLFGPLMCDLWNSMDVYFSTVSILHLCCISIDRYTAIVQPLDYPLRMTRNTVALMLTVAWLAPIFISVLPIFLGWYTTQEQLTFMASNPNLCEFKVNLVYAMVSSSVSFWIPGIIMLVMYFRIYREADRQEMMVFRSTVAAILLNKHLQINGMTRNSVRITDDAHLSSDGTAVVGRQKETNGIPRTRSQQLRTGTLPGSDESSRSPSPSRTPKISVKPGIKRRFLGVGIRRSSGESVGMPVASSAAGNPVEKKQDSAALHKMKRERKAAKTLGIIVSAFLLCWLPFFTWYLVSSLCGNSCVVPEVIVTILFWIGYFNSTLNPIIYAYFNRDFRKAFKKTLIHYWVACGCKSFCELLSCCCKCNCKCCECRYTCDLCGYRCGRLTATQETPSSEMPPRSAISSDYVHIEMTHIDKEARFSGNNR